MSNCKIKEFLDYASAEYYNGAPVITDAQFDALADSVNYSKVGTAVYGSTAPHCFALYSLQKFYPGESKPPLADYTKAKITTPKLDGAAIALTYLRGVLIEVLTRGDGVQGQVVTDKFLATNLVPKLLDFYSVELIQISGELVAPKSIANARNYAAGALNLKDTSEFATRDLYFVAYGIQGNLDLVTYSQSLHLLESLGFKTVRDTDFCENFNHDGIVTRVDSIAEFLQLGYTARHPRGAFATKSRSSGVATRLRDVIWQTGRTGRVTPVAVFDPVVIDGASISRATLNNPGFIEALDLDIGDTIYVEKAGDIIPSVIRSEKNVLETS